MEEVCDFIEERLAPSVLDGSDVRDGCIYRQPTNKELEKWAFAADQSNIDEVRESDD
uniref:Uncharacterized protein n=1 Tax=Peronospora matthiolae TaxID=2874970 RepID=A0AAV1UJM5_9STRA